MKKLLFALLALPMVGLAQISITATGSSSQDFNTLLNTGTAIPWADNTTIPNWYAQRTGTGTSYNANDGASNAGALYSYGSVSQSDRALGSIGSSNASAGSFAHGVLLQNNALTNVSAIEVSYNLEQWRNSAAGAQNVDFYYKKSSSAITNLEPSTNSGWTLVPALSATSPVTGGTAGALNGNAVQNRVTIIDVVIPGLILLPGEYVMLKWADPDHTGSDHGLSIDDVFIDYTVTCETFSFLTETACDEFTLNSTTYNATGIYQQVLDNANIYGCDSTITLDLTIDPLVTYYQDIDGDNFGNALVTVSSCTPVVGYVTVAGDCNDNNNTVYPGAIEICDLLDNDCDGFTDELGSTSYYLDADSDGFGDPLISILTCTPPVGYVLNNTDCDDSDEDINPGATEVCNGFDDNCDGNIDEGVLITFYQDLDADGYGNLAVTATGCSAPIGYVAVGGDCDDTDDAINPGAPEVCNGADENCDGNIDEGVTTTFYEDLDGDNYGNSAVSVTACSAPVGYVAVGGDCDETNAAINPGAVDIIGNGIDEDCSGADATDPLIGIYEFTGVSACPNISTEVTAQPAEAVFSSYSSVNTGCVGAANVFNNDGWNTTATIDLSEFNEFTLTANDCQEMNLSKLTFDQRKSASGADATWILRSSIDNFTSNLATGIATPTIANEIIMLGTEFTNINSITFRFYVTDAPSGGTTWRQDNVSLFGSFSTLTPQTYYADADNDTYGDLNTSISACTAPQGYVSDNTDCDDTDADINPSSVWYEDADGDLLGNSSTTFTGCVPPNNTYVLSGGDCDDTDDAIGDPVGYYVDADNDGFGSADGTVSFLCTDPGTGFSTNNTDCDDAEDTVYPGAPELCDGLDNDCNGQEDDGLTFVDYFLDADQDGFGAGSAINACQSPGSNYVENNDDCDDDLASVFPDATEIMDDGIDQNCDGIDGYAGVNEIALLVNIAPNPSSGIVVIDLSELTTATLVITDLNGKVCHESKIEGQTNSIDLSILTDGVYIVKITSETGRIQKRLVIQK